MNLYCTIERKVYLEAEFDQPTRVFTEYIQEINFKLEVKKDTKLTENTRI